ncbi:hypothetical protein ACP4OV_014496 [Aristida adscensionis]
MAAVVVRACAAATSTPAAGTAGGGSARVLVLGGAGRVGGSTAAALASLRPDLRILVGGRNRSRHHLPIALSAPAQATFILPCHREKGESFAAKLGEQSEFVQVDIRDAGRLEKALQAADLVVHAAGPFEREDKCTVLEAAISTKTAYIDVCVDMDYCWRAKSFHEQAKAAGIPAITTAGIYPGVSNVMAAELVHAARSENAGEPERLSILLLYCGFRRSGGAGPTIMATSILLLGVDVIAYNKGEEIKLKPYTGALNIDFGKGEVLRDKRLIRKLVESVDPLIRAIDGIAGERVSVRVDLECSNGRNTIGLFTHKKLSVSVGQATAAFVLAILEGSTQPGVWFPEEPEGIAIEARKLLLQRASQGTTNFVINK